MQVVIVKVLYTMYVCQVQGLTPPTIDLPVNKMKDT